MIASTMAVAGGSSDVGNDVVQLNVHLIEGLVDVLYLPSALPHEGVAMSPQHADGPHFNRRAETARSNPTECGYCSHWLSNTSVLRPDTFLTWRGLTRHTAMPASSSISANGIQYTLVYWMINRYTKLD